MGELEEGELRAGKEKSEEVQLRRQADGGNRDKSGRNRSERSRRGCVRGRSYLGKRGGKRVLQSKYGKERNEYGQALSTGRLGIRKTNFKRNARARRLGRKEFGRERFATKWGKGKGLT